MTTNTKGAVRTERGRGGEGGEDEDKRGGEDGEGETSEAT